MRLVLFWRVCWYGVCGVRQVVSFEGHCMSCLIFYISRTGCEIYLSFLAQVSIKEVCRDATEPVGESGFGLHDFAFFLLTDVGEHGG